MEIYLIKILRGIAIIGGFIFLIIIHEGGHFLAAKICKIKVTDFFVGFGPKLWSFKRGETTYGISAILLGGYVKMAGDNILEDEDKERTDENGFNKASFTKKLLIVLSGPLTNIVAAFIIIALVFGFKGVIDATNTVAQTIKKTPAYKVLEPGDKILAVNGKQASKWQKITEQIRARPNKIITLTIERKNKLKLIRVKTAKRNNRGFIGIRPQGKKVRNLTIIESIKASAYFIYFVSATISGLIFKAITGSPQLLAKSSSSIIGAVVVGTNYSTSILNYLYFIGSISLVLGYVNLLPIPPLDAGRIILFLLEKIKRRPLKRKTIIGIMAAGFSLLMTLMIYLMVKDIILYVVKAIANMG